MTADERSAAAGSAVKEPRKAKNTDKGSETTAQAANEEQPQPIDAGQETMELDDSLDKTPLAPDKAESHAIKPVAHETTGQDSKHKSTGRLMRFRRKQARRR